jgi:hypothetical protein
MRRHEPAFYLTLAALITACASPGASYKSGVAPKSFDRPPFYAGADVPNGAGVTHLPVRYQRGAEQGAQFEPEHASGSPAAALVADMNAYLDSIAASVKLSPASAEVGSAPDVHFGCQPAMIGGDCLGDGDEDANHRLELSVGRPSPEWIGWLGTALDSTTHDKALRITVELGQYWPRQKGLSLGKEVRLGSDYTVGVPWLTSLEHPVAVVQLTGVLVGRDGRAIRIGAEGMLAKRSHILVSALGAQSLVSDEDIERLRTLRRDDLPNQPLVWQVALRNLVSQLTGLVGQS